jgi:hypothetical protein
VFCLKLGLLIWKVFRLQQLTCQYTKRGSNLTWQMKSNRRYFSSPSIILIFLSSVLDKELYINNCWAWNGAKGEAWSCEVLEKSIGTFVSSWSKIYLYINSTYLVIMCEIYDANVVIESSPCSSPHPHRRKSVENSVSVIPGRSWASSCSSNPATLSYPNHSFDCKMPTLPLLVVKTWITLGERLIHFKAFPNGYIPSC